MFYATYCDSDCFTILTSQVIFNNMEIYPIYCMLLISSYYILCCLIFVYLYLILISKPRNFLSWRFFFGWLFLISMHTTLYFFIFISDYATNRTYLIKIFNKKLIKYTLLIINIIFN